jgi:hypothetical protein
VLTYEMCLRARSRRVYPSDATTYAPMLDDFFPLSMPNAEKVGRDSY